MRTSSVKERGILFQGLMVRALLAKKKRQTRRIVKLRQFGRSDTPGYDWTFRDRRGLWNDVKTDRLLNGEGRLKSLCPYGVAGDRLWVRETFQPLWATERAPASLATPEGWAISYPATAGVVEYHNEDEGLVTRCKPGIHMPRWASRIAMAITSVRVERAHDISAADAELEGVEACDGEIDEATICRVGKETGWGAEDPRSWFGALWCQVNGPESWAANPWVWAISFSEPEVVSGNS